MGAKRHVPRKPAGGMPHRDRGNRREGYNLRSTVDWPTLADGTAWTAAVTRVAHAGLGDAVGVMAPPKWSEEFGWVTVVEWEPGWELDARVVLHNLLPA